MKTKDAIEYFGSVSNLAKALKISQPAVSQWGKYVPEGKGFKLQVMTGGLLQYTPPPKEGN